MDSSATNPETSTSVFTYPETSAEPVKTEKIRTSVSVSSLAEKFEKCLDSVKSGEREAAEDELVFESQMEIKQPAAEDILQNKSDISDTNDFVSKEKHVVEAASQPSLKSSDDSRFCLKKENPGQIEIMEDIAKDKLSCFKVEDDASSDVQEVKIMNDPCVIQQPSGAEADVKSLNDTQPFSQSSSELVTETQISNAVEERVTYFAGKISQSLQDSSTTTAAKAKSEPPASVGDEGGTVSVSTEHDVKYSEVASQISLKDLEESFVTALNLANAAGTKKTINVLRVPSIEITEASDQEEETSSELAEEIIYESKVHKTEVKSPVVTEIESNPKQTNDNVEDPTPSSSTDVQLETKDESEVSKEERKAFFYISSSDLPAQPSNEHIADELQDRAANLEERTESVRTQQSVETKASSCLCSKSVHGAIFLASFLVAIFGFILYNMAHDGKVPDFCEPLGLITAITAGIIGAFSCFCFSFLEAFPRVPVAAYERLVDTENIPSANENASANVQNLDEESWSSETEREFRRQNDMSSTSTSEARVRSSSRQSDHQELIKKTEKLKKEVMGLLDSFTDMMAKLEPTDELAEMESGGVDKSK